ncbi:four-carbon acid sugar kinase family protein [Mesorhizobium sp. LMG17149]|uniref:four-carbon acid sugar kinase family protein n=1 Tax=Mesorhizobium sp. LMG17149 TaxID=2968497 RepID=UPI002118722B|nr:four-carbon acid sugar kinase family protein [Mesorhizobium sp. LMG17149]
MNRSPDGRGLGKPDVLIVADDITGALDTAGYFASPEKPVKVWLDLPPGLSGCNAIDLDSRDLGERAAYDRVTGVFADRKAGARSLSFKKIDSVMRGHPVAESVAAFRAGRFRRALFAPAFPALGRATVNGRQHVVSQDGITPVGPALVDALLGHGVPAAMIGEACAREGFFVADASSDAELAAAIAAFGVDSEDLYVGSGGLASMLAGSRTAHLQPPALDLAICGTNHPVALRQVAAVSGLKTVVMDGSSPMPLEPPFVLLAPSHAASESQARLAIERSLIQLVARLPTPRSVLVTGGSTLRLLAGICGASHFLCEGLYEPGVAVSRMVSATWNGAVIVSKSGGFGSDDLLAHLVFPDGRNRLP